MIRATAKNHVSPAPQRRVVLLGASNLTKGIGTVLETAAHVWGGPQQVLAALGHGRSYGRTARFVGLRMPGIESCGLWSALEQGPRLPTAALVTDIGNDLLYEEPVTQIADWVARCLDRLLAADARVTVTLLPVGNIDALGPGRFRLFRTLFFPGCRISLAEVTRRAVALNEAVARLAAERACRTVEHRTEWYGLDPIHIRFRHRRAAWREIVATWSNDEKCHPLASHAVRRTLFIRTRTPEQRHVLWFEQRGKNPAARFADGSSLAIY